MPIKVPCPNQQCKQPMSCPDEFAGREVSCPQCGEAFRVPARPVASSSAKRLGHYTLVRKIAEGGMGAVYEAVEDNLNRRVALKVLSMKLTKNATFVARFEREARAAAALNHPNMVTVYESGQDKGYHFFAMELVEGETLREWLRRVKAVPVEEALKIIQQVAAALDYAWNHGKIIHRDVKPHNIMLTGGHAKLCDLGLAKSVEQDTTVTVAGSGVGTPDYMAPEQSQSAKDVDCRADIYSLGITLFQMLTGRLPFQGETPYAVVAAHLKQPLPDPRSLNPSISEGAGNLVRRMCAKRPEERYQTHAELMADIDAVLDGAVPDAPVGEIRPVPETLATGRSRRVDRLRRKSSAPAIFGVAALLAASGAVGYFVLTKQGYLEGWPLQPARGRAPTTVAASDTGGPQPGPTRDPLVARAKGMFDYAVDYAEKNPARFEDIIRKFEEVENGSQGTVYAMKASEEAENWRRRRDGRTLAEFEQCRTAAQKHLEAGDPAKAQRVWDEFSESLRTEDTKEQIDKELARIAEAMDSLEEEVRKGAAPLLARLPGTLAEQDLDALAKLASRTDVLAQRVTGEARISLQELGELARLAATKGRGCLEAESVKLREGWWDEYEKRVRAEDFEGAASIVEERRDGFGEALVRELTKDIQELQGLYQRAKEDLPRIVGTTVRVGGARRQIAAVRDGTVFIKHGEAEIGFGIGKLDLRTVLELVEPREGEEELTTRQRSLLAYYVGTRSEAIGILRKAAETEAHVSRYLHRLIPVIRAVTIPPGTGVTVEKQVREGEWVPIDEQPRVAPFLQEVSGDTRYRLTAVKEGHEPVVREIKVGECGEHRVALVLRETPLPTELAGDFEVPTGREDAHGNPIRKGMDKDTGLPLEIRHKATSMHFAFVPAGKFIMGLPEGAPGYSPDFTPERRITLTRPFYLGKYEVTQKEWGGVMGENNSTVQGRDLPVHLVQWRDCRAFLGEMNELVEHASGQVAFCLPTEAQWEYACRAGSRTGYFFGGDEHGQELGGYAWYNANSSYTPHQVGRKKPSPWGLYDILGNVAEWCHDRHGPYVPGAQEDPLGPTIPIGYRRVCRGGSWQTTPDYCRSGHRAYHEDPVGAQSHLGLRVALVMAMGRLLPEYATYLVEGRTDEGLSDKVEGASEMIELVEAIEKDLIDSQNRRLKVKVDDIQYSFKKKQDRFGHHAENYERYGKDWSAEAKKNYRSARAKFSRERDAYDAAMLSARKAKDGYYEKVHGNALRLIRAIKAGQRKALSRDEVEAMLTN